PRPLLQAGRDQLVLTAAGFHPAPVPRLCAFMPAANKNTVLTQINAKSAFSCFACASGWPNGRQFSAIHGEI
ncbi:MAG: hypothetical protein ACLPJJ_13540, partial [Acidocella sp.]|uniref:hypothetical protein n=1 Tax=Acidocella sp. TaxID=50710 RepID=UPI003FD8D6F2